MVLPAVALTWNLERLKAMADSLLHLHVVRSPFFLQNLRVVSSVNN